jgi:hypothetical protein
MMQHATGSLLMSENNLNTLFEVIGGLKESVDGIKDTLVRHEKRSVDDARLASDHRAVVHRRIDEVSRELGTIHGDMKMFKEDLTDAKTVTDEVKQWKQRGVGALFVAGLTGSAFTAGIIYFWEALLKTLRL